MTWAIRFEKSGEAWTETRAVATNARASWTIVIMYKKIVAKRETLSIASTGLEERKKKEKTKRVVGAVEEQGDNGKWTIVFYIENNDCPYKEGDRDLHRGTITGDLNPPWPRKLTAAEN